MLGVPVIQVIRLVARKTSIMPGMAQLNMNGDTRPALMMLGLRITSLGHFILLDYLHVRKMVENFWFSYCRFGQALRPHANGNFSVNWRFICFAHVVSCYISPSVICSAMSNVRSE
jgi:hypothetical protein